MNLAKKIKKNLNSNKKNYMLAAGGTVIGAAATYLYTTHRVDPVVADVIREQGEVKDAILLTEKLIAHTDAKGSLRVISLIDGVRKEYVFMTAKTLQELYDNQK